MHIVEKVTCFSGIKIWNCWEDEKKKLTNFEYSLTASMQ